MELTPFNISPSDGLKTKPLSKRHIIIGTFHLHPVTQSNKVKQVGIRFRPEADLLKYIRTHKQLKRVPSELLAWSFIAILPRMKHEFISGTFAEFASFADKKTANQPNETNPLTR